MHPCVFNDCRSRLDGPGVFFFFLCISIEGETGADDTHLRHVSMDAALVITTNLNIAFPFLRGHASYSSAFNVESIRKTVIRMEKLMSWSGSFTVSQGIPLRLKAPLSRPRLDYKY